MPSEQCCSSTRTCCQSIYSNQMMASTSSSVVDPDVEISEKDYQKISATFVKEGFREGVTEGRDSIFQDSFDKGYEDGFKAGYQLGLRSAEKASRGSCGICANPSLMEKPETEAREVHRNQFDSREQQK